MGIAFELLRFKNRDGTETTVYLVRHPAALARVSVVHFEEPTRLDQWCTAAGHPEAIVAAFFVRDPYRPLGEIRIDGEPLPYEPVAEPWASARACPHVDGAVQMSPRGRLAAEPPGGNIQLQELTLTKRPGDVVTVDCQRAGKSAQARITLAAQP